MKNWKLWQASTAVEFYIFCTRFRLANVYKRVLGIFFILFGSWIIDKPGFCECVESRSFLFWQITQFLNKILKNPEHPFVDSGKQEMCIKFQQKLLKSTVIGTLQSFQFFRQDSWFLENNRGLLNFWKISP